MSGVVPGLAGAGLSAVAGVSSPVSKAKPRSTAAGEGLTPAAASFSPSAGLPHARVEQDEQQAKDDDREDYPEKDLVHASRLLCLWAGCPPGSARRKIARGGS